MYLVVRREVDRSLLRAHHDIYNYTSVGKDDTLHLLWAEDHDNPYHTHLCRDLDMLTGDKIWLDSKADRCDDSHLSHPDFVYSINSDSAVVDGEDHRPLTNQSPGIGDRVEQSRTVGDMLLRRDDGEDRQRDVLQCMIGMGLKVVHDGPGSQRCL